MGLIPTFFDYLAIADKERIHSQMLAWIFSETCEALSREQKWELFCKLFGDDNLSKPENIKFSSKTEHENIDLIITSGNYCCVIENKLKSSQHSNQLQKYEAIAQSPELKCHRKTFLFLTLVGERASSENWKNLSYKSLLNFIQQIILQGISIETFHRKLLHEYLTTLTNLVYATDSFLNDDSRKSSYNQPQSEVWKYIQKNKLETILQKALLQEIANDEQLIKLIPERLRGKIDIGETHAKAYLGICLFDSICLLSKDGISRKFNAGVQFQNNKAKVYIAAEDYQNSKKEWLSAEAIKWFEDNFENNGFERHNLPRTKTFLSMTRQLFEDTIWCQPQNNIRDKFMEEIETATKVLSNFLAEVK